MPLPSVERTGTLDNLEFIRMSARVCGVVPHLPQNSGGLCHSGVELRVAAEASSRATPTFLPGRRGSAFGTASRLLPFQCRGFGAPFALS